MLLAYGIVSPHERLSRARLTTMPVTITATLTPLAASSAARLPNAPPRRWIGWPERLLVLASIGSVYWGIVFGIAWHTGWI